MTNEEGQPLAGAEVFVNHFDLDTSGHTIYPFKVTRATTDVLGRYQMTISASVLETAGASLSGSEYESDWQVVTPGPSPIERNFHLNHVVRIGTENAVTIVFRSDDSRCGGDECMAYEYLVRYVHVAVPAAGTLTVTASTPDGSAIRPRLIGIDGSWPSGDGAITFAVTRGEERKVAVMVPVGMPLSTVITTSLEAR